MPTICPTITAYTEKDYKHQLAKITDLGSRIQIDLTDGEFTDQVSITPDKAWWPAGLKVDFHLMYNHPFEAVKKIIKHSPHLIIVQAESKDNFQQIISFCHEHKVKIGIALLPATDTKEISYLLDKIDHVLIFSGNLGYQGGSSADLALLDKVSELKELKSELEIGWDGGVNDQNIAELVNGGVEVINVGGYIQNASDPSRAFESLQRIADETGET